MILVENRKAKAEFQVLEKFQAGVVLSGAEVKSIRLKQASLQGSFVKVIGSELYLINALVTPYKFARQDEVDSRRSRKLLVHRRELIQLQEVTTQKGKTLIPLSFELVHNKIKLNFAVARGKKQFERREEIKKRDLARELQRNTKIKSFA